MTTKESHVSNNSPAAQPTPASTDWMHRAGYGIMVHWTGVTIPQHGAKLPYAEAVARFDVKAFAQQLEEAGAGYLIFTLGHNLVHMPFPSAIMDARLPGLT